MLERLLDIEVGEHGGVTEEIELICTMTGFRLRFLILTSERDSSAP
jgi:hypothetical protein